MRPPVRASQGAAASKGVTSVDQAGGQTVRGDQDFDPPPGRDILVSPQHNFRQLAEAINALFARWDLGHLFRRTFHLTVLGDGR